MKKLLSLLAIPVLASALSLAQDRPASSTDSGKASTADQAAATQPAAADQTAPADDAARTEPRRAAEDRDYGWIGLLGLVGLAGLMRRDRARVDYDRTRDNVTTLNRERDDVRRAG